MSMPGLSSAPGYRVAAGDRGRGARASRYGYLIAMSRKRLANVASPLIR
jgi:hypothetical protein